MKGQTLQVRVVGGMEHSLPQEPTSANLIDNWTVERSTLGLSSRIGYEKYRPDPADGFTPFGGLGRIDSLFVMQQSTGGARQSILFESGGALFLYYEVGQANVIFNLGSRFAPTATDTASVYAQYGDRVIITNGYDSPIIVRPWPLPRAVEVTPAQLASLSRQIGWYGPPPQPNPLRVATIDAGTPMASANEYTGDSTSNWYPAAGKASVFPNIFGMGAEEAGAADERNVFQFAVSFISDTGSVSPQSITVEVVWAIKAGDNNVRYAPSIRIPLGPPGTVARRIYGSLNGERELYFIADVRNNVEELFHCARREVSFSVPAPQLVDSVIFPASRARCCAIYKSCLWLDGGADEGNRLYYSVPTFIDQFGAADYIALASNGGAVTGLYAHYNNLLVFRENGIDIVTGSYPNFSVQSLSEQIACRSPQTIDAVPGQGVFFLALDGIYSIAGGLDGGSTVQLKEVGAPISAELKRLTKECAARAVGKYSPIERAYHCYFPADGDDRPNLGVVYHVEKEGWSVRSGFPVGCIDRLFNGTLVFGHHTGNQVGQNEPAGLFVLSGTRAMGGTIVQDEYKPGDPPVSVYETAWHDFGDAQVKKQVQYITLWIMTTGSVALVVDDFKDFEYEPIGTNNVYLAQPPDENPQAVYGTAIIGSDTWQDTRLAPIRIAVAQRSCSWFKFRLTTTDDLVLVGYELEYTARGTNVIAGRTT